MIGKNEIKVGRNFVDMIKEYDLLVIDEIFPAIDLKLITQKQLFDFFDNKPKELEVICTGRVTNKIFMSNLTSVSNLHSDIMCRKHYFSCRCPECGRSWDYHYIFCPNDGKRLEQFTKARYGIEL